MTSIEIVLLVLIWLVVGYTIGYIHGVKYAYYRFYELMDKAKEELNNTNGTELKHD